MGFAAGVFVAFAASVALSSIVSPLRIGVLNVTAPFIGFLVGGAIAGHSLRIGRRGVVGFAVALALALPIVGLHLIGIQARPGNERFLTLAIDFGGTGGLAFAVMGSSR
jgi:hypothetical protein